MSRYRPYHGLNMALEPPQHLLKAEGPAHLSDRLMMPRPAARPLLVPSG